MGIVIGMAILKNNIGVNTTMMLLEWNRSTVKQGLGKLP